MKSIQTHKNEKQIDRKRCDALANSQRPSSAVVMKLLRKYWNEMIQTMERHTFENLLMH